MANSFRTRGVEPELLVSSATVTVVEGDETLEFQPVVSQGKAGLVFLCGSGVSARAYAPLLRPLAERGFPVIVVKLPYRFAFLEAHRREAVARARRVMAGHPEVPRWVVSGHSLGAALACRLTKARPEEVSALVLLGTTHPRDDDLSSLPLPVTKVFATLDGVAPLEKVEANRDRLPAHTRWVEITGGNHSQFGHYGHQLFDGRATLSREVQQERSRTALLDALDGHQLEEPGPWRLP